MSEAAGQESATAEDFRGAGNNSSPPPPSSPPLLSESERGSDTMPQGMEFEFDDDGLSMSDVNEEDRAESDGTLQAAADSVRSEDVESERMDLPKAASHSNMPPPPRPEPVKVSLPAKASEQERPSGPVQMPPPSGQGMGKPAQPGSAVEVTNMSNNDVDPLNPPSEDPEETIERFDWGDLEQRYHDRVRALDVVHDEAVEEFSSLCSVFRVWANAGSSHEVDRSFKRLKTQMALVQHHEDQLELKRQHYIRVVDAFKSALELLT